MPITVLVPLLLQAAPTIFQLGADAIAGYKAIVAAMRIKAGTPEETAALDAVEAHMHWLDVQIANAPEPN